MKKLVLLLLGFFLLFGVAACNNGGSEVDIDLDEYIASPTNLAITGKVLSWDAVENADGYIVYVNGEEEDNVKTNSFDFSGLEGDKLIFQVKTKAPRGMQDSGLSISIAYVANPAAEITAINTRLASSNMNLPEGFADELVAKGMIGTEFDDMMDEVDAFLAAVEEAETLTEFYNAIDQMLSSVENVEALVSAIIKTLLAEQIAMTIQENLEDLEYYQEWYDREDDLYYKEWLGDQISDLEDQNSALEELLDQIENNPDYLVMSVTTTMEYFMSIEEMISTDLIGYLQNLSETDSPQDVNVNEVVLIKEEIVDILRETMPTQDDMVLMYEVYNTLMAVSGEVVNIENNVENYIGKMAAQSLLTMEAFINYLDLLDTDYFTAVLAELSVAEPGPLNAAEVAILSIKYFDTFKEENEALLDQIQEIFTDEEQEQLFDDYVAGLSYYETNEAYPAIIALMGNINFQLLLTLQTEFEEAFDAALDAFVARDGELLRQVVILQSFYSDWWDETYYNYATGDEYDDYNEYQQAMTVVQFTVAEEAFYILDAVMNVTDNEDFQTVIELIFDMIPADELALELDIETAVMTALLTLGETTLNSVSQDTLELLKNAVSYVVDEEVFATFIQLMDDMYEYEQDTYGEDYYYDDPYLDYAPLIVIAGIYDDFMTNGNRGLLDDIIAEIITAMYDTNVKDLTMLTDEEIGNLETNIDDLLDFVKDGLGDIANLNADNLSAADITLIEDFLMGLQSQIMTLPESPSN